MLARATAFFFKAKRIIISELFLFNSTISPFQDFLLSLLGNKQYGPAEYPAHHSLLRQIPTKALPGYFTICGTHFALQMVGFHLP